MSGDKGCNCRHEVRPPNGWCVEHGYVVVLDGLARTQERNPLIRTPDGIPIGWHVYIDKDGVPVLGRNRDQDAP